LSGIKGLGVHLLKKNASLLCSAPLPQKKGDRINAHVLLVSLRPTILKPWQIPSAKNGVHATTGFRHFWIAHEQPQGEGRPSSCIVELWKMMAIR